MNVKRKKPSSQPAANSREPEPELIIERGPAFDELLRDLATEVIAPELARRQLEREAREAGENQQPPPKEDPKQKEDT